ncbi:hypothetical protein GJ496_001572 [Pomphorhynchus laevis]|nr:hypothetical protein GJ496_001572 [Pomphorhynchus laevis]
MNYTTISIKVKELISSIESLCATLNRPAPKIIAVSKLKSVEDIIAAYDAGLRTFGENYVNELHQKATNPELLSKCPHLSWHFIGHLQSNKINKLLKVPNLVCIETVDSLKLADELHSKVQQLDDNSQLKKPLPIFVQLNINNEANKSGLSLDHDYFLEVCSHIIQNCKTLDLSGLMTIGSLQSSLAEDSSMSSNPDFVALSRCRDRLASLLERNSCDFELSMGMSNDYECAIRCGSTNVRIGSHIFGVR